MGLRMRGWRRCVALWGWRAEEGAGERHCRALTPRTCNRDGGGGGLWRLLRGLCFSCALPGAPQHSLPRSV